MGESARTMVRTSQDSAQIVTDYLVKAQELNTQLAQRTVETWIDGLRRQTQLSQDVARELFGRADEQVDAYRRFFGQWGNGFISFPFAGATNAVFPFQRQGMRSEEHTSELQSRQYLVCRLLLEKTLRNIYCNV